MKIERIQLGYWYPHTTLHLAEIQDFFAGRKTPLHLNAAKLVALRSKLGIVSSEVKLGELEYLDMHTRSGIRVRVFEDGLVTFSGGHTQLSHDINELTDYFEKAYLPAMRYLFSVGAPTPKELANMDHEFPCFIVTRGCRQAQATAILDELGAALEFELDTKDMILYHGGKFFIVEAKPHFSGVEELIETWVYFKEFKSQLHHYLNLHRSVWSQIEAIKEARHIRGWQVKAQRDKLESYKKTIELMESRLAQMVLYMDTRSQVATARGWDEYLSGILQFHYTNLKHTHEYVKSLWAMTRQYVDSAIHIMTEVNDQGTKISVQILTIISSLGVIGAIMNYLSVPKLPVFNQLGLKYFLMLLAIAAVINIGVGLSYKIIRYRINATHLAKDLHKYAQRNPSPRK